MRMLFTSVDLPNILLFSEKSTVQDSEYDMLMYDIFLKKLVSCLTNNLCVVMANWENGSSIVYGDVCVYVCDLNDVNISYSKS